MSSVTGSVVKHVGKILPELNMLYGITISYPRRIVFYQFEGQTKQYLIVLTGSSGSVRIQHWLNFLKCRYGIVLRLYSRTQSPNRFRHLSQWLTHIWVLLMNHSHGLQSFHLLLAEQQREKVFWVAISSNRKVKKLQTTAFLLRTSEADGGVLW